MCVVKIQRVHFCNTFNIRKCPRRSPLIWVASMNRRRSVETLKMLDPCSTTGLGNTKYFGPGVQCAPLLIQPRSTICITLLENFRKIDRMREIESSIMEVRKICPIHVVTISGHLPALVKSVAFYMTHALRSIRPRRWRTFPICCNCWRMIQGVVFWLMRVLPTWIAAA